MAIGHVRYSTTGSSSWENAQPVLALRPARARAGPQRQPHQRGRAALRAASSRASRSAPRATRRSSPRCSPPTRRAHRGRGDGRRAAPAGRVLDRGHDPRQGRRVPRPRGPAPAGAGHARRALLRGLGVVRLRHHRRQAAARGRAGRDGRRSAPKGLYTKQAVKSDREAMCVFEYIYFARPDSRMGGDVLQASRGRMGEMLVARGAGGRRPRDRRARLRQRRRPRLRARERAAPGRRLREEPLRRAHVHPARAGAAQARPAAEVQPAARGRRRASAWSSSTTRSCAATRRARSCRCCATPGAAEVHMRISAPPIRTRATTGSTCRRARR